MTQVVALLNYDSGQSELARSLTSAFSPTHLDLELRNHAELVAEVSVKQSPGQQPRVLPDRPLLWLSTADPGTHSSVEERFLSSETMAASRSIAILTGSPVLNRPSAVSPYGRLPLSSALAARRTRRVIGDIGIRAERFADTLPDGAGISDLFEVYDYSTGRGYYWPGADLCGPFRHRRALPDSQQVRVRLVGGRAMTSAPVPAAVVDASFRIAAWYQLDMATLWWLISHENEEAIVARVDCSTWDRSLFGQIDEVADALLTWVWERTSGSTSTEAP